MTQEHDNSNDPLHAKKKAWSGRFSEPVDAFVLRYTASVDFDKRMAMADIDGSLAHAAMLAKVGVITEQDLADIRRGMAQIREEITSATPASVCTPVAPATTRWPPTSVCICAVKST